MAVVLCNFGWLWIREFLDESGLTPADSSNPSPHSGQQSQVTSISRSGSGAARHSGSCPGFRPGVPPSVRGCSSSSSASDEDDDSSWSDWSLLGGVCGPSYHRELSSETFVLFAELLILLLEVCFLLLKFINAIFESSDPLKQLLHFFVSDHHNSPRSVQTTRDGLPCRRPSLGEHPVVCIALLLGQEQLTREWRNRSGVNTYASSIRRWSLHPDGVRYRPGRDGTAPDDVVGLVRPRPRSGRRPR